MILMIGLQNLMKHNTKNFQVILTSTLSNIKKIGLILTFTIIHILRELNLRLQKSEHNISTLIINQKVTGLTFQVHNFSEYNLKLIHAQQNLRDKSHQISKPSLFISSPLSCTLDWGNVYRLLCCPSYRYRIK